MHELSVCQAIVTQVEQIALQHQAEVFSITLRIGPLSGVEASLIEQAYPLAVAGTGLSAARLIIDSLPVRVRCLSCHAAVPTARWRKRWTRALAQRCRAVLGSRN